jgi:1,4-dihydroxy-2-naphthoate octaprenyltransferase
MAALFCALLIQVGANLVNDVVDFQKGTDTADRLGPTRVTLAGLLTPRQVWFGVGVVFGLAGLFGLYLAIAAGPVVILIGLVCILAAFTYTMGPYPLARHGLGDLFALLLFGIVGVCGTAFVILGYVPPEAWWGGLGAGVQVTNILVVNNVRDIESDRRAGRKNIPVRWGRGAGELEYYIMLGLAYMAPLAAFGFGHAPVWALLALLSLPEAVSLSITFHRTPTGKALNGILARTARLLLVYALLFGAGLALGGLPGFLP